MEISDLLVSIMPLLTLTGLLLLPLNLPQIITPINLNWLTTKLAIPSLHLSVTLLTVQALILLTLTERFFLFDDKIGILTHLIISTTAALIITNNLTIILGVGLAGIIAFLIRQKQS